MVISLILLGATMSVASRSSTKRAAPPTTTTRRTRRAPTSTAWRASCAISPAPRSSLRTTGAAASDRRRERLRLRVPRRRRGASRQEPEPANVKRVRYCLDATDPERGVLYQQEQRWTDRRAATRPQCHRLTAARRRDGLDMTTRRNRARRRTVRRPRPAVVRLQLRRAVREISQVARRDLYVDPDPTRAPARRGWRRA